MAKDFIDVHTHTLASGHAYNTIHEMAQAAAAAGIFVLGITEHAPKMPGSCHTMYFMNLKVLRRELYGVRMLFGAELNVLDMQGTLDLPDSVLDTLDIAVASIHLPCYQKGTKEQNSTAYINAMKNPHVNIIGHPDDERLGFDYEMLVEAAKEHHVLLEVNNSSLAPNGYRVGAWQNYLTMLALCKRLEVPVIMSRDAHTAFDVGNHEYAKKLLLEADFPERLIANYSEALFLEYVPKAGAVCERNCPDVPDCPALSGALTNRGRPGS